MDTSVNTRHTRPSEGANRRLQRFHSHAYSVSLAISELYSVKVWPDLEIWVSRSFKTARFDRSCSTLYWSAIVTIALSYIIFLLFDGEKYCDLEI